MSAEDLSALWLTLKLAGISTAVLFLIGTPIAWWLAQTKSRLKVPVEALVALPLVLPPTVLGFYLLIALSPNSAIGGFWLSVTGDTLTFSFAGLVIGSVLYSLPFMIQPLQTAFERVGRAPLELAATLRASPLDTFFSVVIPNSSRGIATAGVLSFAHTLGEFGVVLIIGGNIPERTKVVSIAIYEHVEALDYSQAHALSATLLVLSFLTLLLVYAFNRRFPVHVG